MKPVIDLHTDFVLSLYEKGREFRSNSQINLTHLKKAQTKLIFAGFSYDDYFADTDKQLNILLKESNKGILKLILNKKNLRNLKDRIGIILHLEGAKVLENDLNKIHKYYESGLRSLSLTHAKGNLFASGNKIDNRYGLTPKGKELIALAKKLNIIIDLAHLNKKSFFDVLDIIDKPPIVTHTCYFNLCRDPRNLDDKQIKEIAARKGVIGIFFSSKYVKNKGKSNIDDVCCHFIKIAEIGGVETVAIGSDFGGITTGIPEGLENFSKLNYLFKKLKEKGFSASDIEKISYQNAQRVIENYL